MRAIIVTYNGGIQAISVVNEDDVEHVLHQLQTQIDEAGGTERSGFAVRQAAIDPIQTVIAYAISA
jgi:hypothetical protein